MPATPASLLAVARHAHVAGPPALSLPSAWCAPPARAGKVAGCPKFIHKGRELAPADVHDVMHDQVGCVQAVLLAIVSWNSGREGPCRLLFSKR